MFVLPICFPFFYYVIQKIQENECALGLKPICKLRLADDKFIKKVTRKICKDFFQFWIFQGIISDWKEVFKACKQFLFYPKLVKNAITMK